MSPSKQETLSYFTPNSMPYGLSYGQWTVRWWQWIASIPTNKNPAADNTGRNCGINQTHPHVWFLAGTFGGKTAQRKCTISGWRSVLFPVINYQMNPLEKPELQTESELIKHVQSDEDDIINLEAIVNGQTIPIFRVQSDPLLFKLQIADDNPLEVKGGGITSATSDGYWVFLKPLPIGEYEINFSGSCSAGSRNVKVNYIITVTN
jgi:hypothetical protein